MAEVTRPEGEPVDDRATAASEPVRDAEGERAVRATTGSASSPEDDDRREPGSGPIPSHEERTGAVVASAGPADRGQERDERPARPAPPAHEPPVLAPASHDAPPAPKRHGNRLVGTAWVLLAAGLFQLLYFGALALIILLLGGPAAVGPGIANISRFPFAWLPVLFFFLLFELTVLLFNRAGRFAYVVASLVVGLLVYVLSVLLISIMVGGGIGDTATLARAFESPEFVLTGLIAREVMLWTGFAIGARGTRVRRRDREARTRYTEEVADVRA